MPLLLERCPVCRASAAALEDPPVCHRCGADLGFVVAALEQAREAVAESHRALHEGDLTRAIALAQLAVATVDAPESRAALAAARGRRDVV